MGKIDYKAIYDRNKHGWYDMTENPQKYEALLSGHYSDSNHFVSELLQNAEDAFEVNEKGIFDQEIYTHANKVVIEYYEDKLVFYHNGKPFDEEDARGVSSMLMGTKDRNDAQTIGRFGMGFKSVFKYTYQPEIYSDDEAFKITRYLLPVEITDGWDYEEEKKSIVCKLGESRYFTPFLHEKHLTKIVIPFKKYGKDGELVSVPGDDVLKKLDDLNGEILLFLTHIQNLYWVNKETGKYAHITLSQDEKDEHMITCRIEGSDYYEKEEISRYLKFKRLLDHPDMKNAEVSVAYKLNSRADNINEVEDSPVWVYFPTRDDTDLPFLIHGSFETAVSREKLMTPSDFNNDLFDELGDLIAESLTELAVRKLITQVFIRSSLIGAFEDEEENETIPGLKEKVTSAIKEHGLLPDRNGVYRKPEDMMLPVPFRMGDFADRPLIGQVFEGKAFVAFNNEREANFSDYYNWLVNDLKVRIYKLSELADDLGVLTNDKVPNSGEVYDTLKDFYDFLTDHRESVYETGLSYTRSGPYEQTLRRDLKDAWKALRQAPIILNRLNKLVSAEIEDKPAVYLGSSSEYKSVMQAALVNKDIADTFGKVLSEGFQIQEFNNFQYIKEKVIQKYIDIGDTLGFSDLDNFTDEYIEDLNQIFSLIDETGNVAEVRELLKDAYIIKIKPEEDDDLSSFNKPCYCYIPVSDEGINLNVYFSKIPYEGLEEEELDDPENWYEFDVDAIDSDYYEENGIAISKLAKLGLITSPVTDGKRSENGVGDNYWYALGEFCPNISIHSLADNLTYIEEYYEQDLAKKKSAEILKLLLTISGKLQGKRRKRQRNPYDGDLETCYVLWNDIHPKAWLYDKDMQVHSPKQMSRYDLNTALYDNLSTNKKAYEILGFIEKDVDEAEETLQKASNLNRQDKKRLLNWLAKDLGLRISDGSEEDDDWETEDTENNVFNPNAWQDDDFPVNRVSNIDYLVRHVQEQFYCADPTTYQKVWRRIRVSKNAKADRTYAIGMYTNASNTKICQICRKPVAFIEVPQIANFGIEMPQLNLCLCRECSAQYSAIRDANKDEFKKQICGAIKAIDMDEYAKDYSIEFNADMTLHFTQTHVAELQEIFRLLAEYGTPSKNADTEEDDPISGPLIHLRNNLRDELRSPLDMTPRIIEEVDACDEEGMSRAVDDPDVAREGSFITYKKRFATEDIVDNTLQPKKFPFHKKIEGHRPGDVIRFQGREYELLSVIN